MEILCLILARGGSVRIPRKNIKILGGKPLIAYTIECAKKSNYIDRIIVSTDDREIASVARQFGAETPFERPEEVSRVDSTELDAFRHALGWLKENEGYEPDIIVKLFATSPFRKVESVDYAIRLLLDDPHADAVRSVSPCTEHPFKMWRVEGKRLKHLIPPDEKPDQAHTLSYQVLPRVYVNNASIDVTRPSNIWKKNSITGTEIIPFVMDDEIESHDINNPIDFELAKLIVNRHTTN